MSDLIGKSPAARPQADLARSLETAAMVFVLALGVGALYVGRDVFIPIAIAILLSFVLSPPILLLRRLGLGRTPSVLSVVGAALVVAFVVGAVLTRQVAELAVDLPKYQTTVNNKIRHIRDAVADNAAFAKLSAAVKNMSDVGPVGEVAKRPQAGAPPRGDAGAMGAGDNPRPIPVEVHQPEKGPFDLIQTIAGNALSPVETTFLVVIFVVFILLQREDLRNRFIRLVGSGDLQRTTLAMNDAASRLSRFFLVQTLLNATFGLVVAGGLYVIGLPSPILWGIIAFLMRFVPYIGAIVSAGFPFVVAAAVDPGWAMALQTLALFLVAETIVAYVIEPWLYGHHTGISPIAVIASATFWTWLWGAVGLVLSTPLTVCLVVLGRHVDRLTFLDVIFGDAPALNPTETFYQRVLVGDASEVTDQAERFLKDHSLAAYYDEVALPALAMAQADARRGVLDEARQRRIRETVDEIIEDLSDQAEGVADAAQPVEAEADYAPDPSSGHPSPGHPSPVHPSPISAPSVLCIAGRNALDEAAAALLAQILAQNGIGASIEPPGALAASRIARLAEANARIVCLSYLDAEASAASARFAIRRLRRRLPRARILAGFWKLGEARAGELQAEVKPDFCATSLRDALSICLGDEGAALAETGAAQPKALVGAA